MLYEKEQDLRREHRYVLSLLTMMERKVVNAYVDGKEATSELIIEHRQRLEHIEKWLNYFATRAGIASAPMLARLEEAAAG
jgi:hypothetical protein